MVVDGPRNGRRDRPRRRVRRLLVRGDQSRLPPADGRRRLGRDAPEPVLAHVAGAGSWTAARSWQASRRRRGRRRRSAGSPPPPTSRRCWTSSASRPSTRAMVGDDIVNDVVGAQALGLTGVLVRTGKFAASDLERGEPDHVIDALADLPALLARLSRHDRERGAGDLRRDRAPSTRGWERRDVVRAGRTLATEMVLADRWRTRRLQVLDVASGHGAGLARARRRRPDRVTALDASEAMLSGRDTERVRGPRRPHLPCSGARSRCRSPTRPSTRSRSRTSCATWTILRRHDRRARARVCARAAPSRRSSSPCPTVPC